MKADAIMKALGLAEGRGMAENALNAIPEGGMPDDLPEIPQPEAMGPPETVPPVDTGEAPQFDEATGLPLMVLDKLPEGFRSGDDDDDDGGDVDLL